MEQSAKSKQSKIFVCNCEKTMHLDEKQLRQVFESNNDISFHTQLCRRQIKSYENNIEAESCLVACTQEVPIFLEIAEEKKRTENVHFVNIRERAGWSSDQKNITAKMVALLAEATLKKEPAKVKTIESDGMCFIYGSGQVAIDAATRLAKHLPVSLILKQDEDIILPEMISVPIYRGNIKTLSGSLGSFKLSIEQYSALNPSSRDMLNFSEAKQTKTACSLFLDLSGDTPLISAHEKRDGYFRVDPKKPLSISETLFDLIDMVGVFEKPIYVEYNSEICAHARSKKVGCTNCLDVCAASAITPDGDYISVDPQICAGCGACAAVCPTGAISYTVPHRKKLVERIQTLCNQFLKAGGQKPVLLIHDETHGMPLIAAIARYGRGLPGHVIPLSLYSITLLGHDIFASALSAGFTSVVILCNPKKQEELSALETEITIANDLITGLSCDDHVSIKKLIEDDPQKVEEFLYGMEPVDGLKPTLFKPLGTRREIARAAILALVKAAQSSIEMIPLKNAAPYGKIDVNTETCTLCLACVSSCPANALADNPDQPQLRFTEAACVQCGICKNTCPENAITLHPRLNLIPSAMQPLTLHEEEPFQCIKCGTPFAAKSTINRMVEQLADTHWMYKDDRVNLLKMCDTCRIEVQAEASGGDPFAFGKRPKVVTSQDYIDAEKQELTIEDFLKKQEE